MSTATLSLDIEKAQQIGMGLLGDSTGAIVGALMVVADRLGLFDTLAPTAPASTAATPASGCRRWPAAATSPTTTRPRPSP